MNLVICESFYSIQGEGRSAGCPAVFLRLAGCNLRCNGFSYKDPVSGEHLGCDSKALWRRGNKKSFGAIVDHWQANTCWQALSNGAHLVVTGGEPTLQQRQLTEFFSLLKQELQTEPYIELETNATQLLKQEFTQHLSQINASPKLAHSGELLQHCYKPDVIAQLAALPETIFKFVVNSVEDWSQIYNLYIQPFAIARQRICLMAEGGTVALLAKKEKDLVELCKREYVNYSPRLHIQLWGEVTGV